MHVLTPEPAAARRDLESPLLPPHTPSAKTIEAGIAYRKRLLAKLWSVGAFCRVLTLTNVLALGAAASYSLYLYQQRDFKEVTWEDVVRGALERGLMGLSGLVLLGLEWAACTDESAARSSLGLAFSAGGRLLLFTALALASAPAVLAVGVHLEEPGELEFYATGGAVALLVVSALLQAWVLSCSPEYRSTAVAALEEKTLRLDTQADAFPQTYQRDAGESLHLGVLLPGFSSRPCTLQVLAERVTLCGEVEELDAPFSPVDRGNSSSGPFGPFARSVELAHAIDVTAPIESRMGLGILEFKFAKGYAPPPPA